MAVTTTGTVYVDGSFQAHEGRGRVILLGRLLAGGNSNFAARDFNLKTLRTITLTPWYGGGAGFAQGTLTGRNPIIATGSIGSIGQLNNYVAITALQFKNYGRKNGYPGTIALGTIAGSARMSFIAVGD